MGKIDGDDDDNNKNTTDKNLPWIFATIKLLLLWGSPTLQLGKPKTEILK